MGNVERKEGVVKSGATNEATPRPWRYFMQGDSSAYVVTDGSPGERGSFEIRIPRVCGEEEKRAALIVEAVNAYDSVRELVEAARELANDADRYLRNVPQQGWIDPTNIARIRAALAKVEGSR